MRGLATEFGQRPAGSLALSKTNVGATNPKPQLVAPRRIARPGSRQRRP